VLSTTLIAVEALAVITIMPTVARDLGGLELYPWVFSGFMLASLIGTVAAGREADRVGPARPFAIGVLAFGGGLVIAAAASSMGMLVAGRVLQGLGAGAEGAVSYVAIGRGLPPELRTRMFAVLSSAWVLPGLLGPAISAAITAAVGWRWVFFGLLPLICVAAVLALPALLALGPPQEHEAVEHRLRDALAAAAGSGLLLAGLTAHHLLPTLALAACGLLLGTPALRRLLPPGTLAARSGLPAVILSRGLLTFAFFGADAFVTLTLTTVLHHGNALASVVITTSTLAWTAGSWLQVRLITSWPERRLIRAGLVLVVGAIAGMVVALRPGVPVALAAVAWTIAGFGMGLAYAPTSLMTLREVPAGRTGWASASLYLSDVLGTALGAGIAGAAIVAGQHHGWAKTTAVSIAFAVAGAGGVVALAISRRLSAGGVTGAG
jgi:MFS family permease